MRAQPVTALVLSPYRTSTADAVAGVAGRRRLDVVRLEGSSPPVDLRGRSCLYAARLFGDLVAEQLALGLLEPPTAWLADLPRQFTGRYVDVVAIARAWQLRRPVFVKPADGKTFAARVYPDGTYLPGADAVDPGTPVVVSEQLTPLAEYRLFVLDGEVVTASRYATGGELDVLALTADPRAEEVLGFAATVLHTAGTTLPSAAVIDVGLVRLPGQTATQWVVVEANAAWSSGVYGCDPDRVLDTVVRSAGPRDVVAGRDEPFLRHL